MFNENSGPREGYQFVEIRISPSNTAPAYKAELSVHGGPVFQAPLELDRERLIELNADPEAYGLALGKMLFADNVLGNAYREAFAVAQRNGKGLRVRLRLVASDLDAMHWERIYYPRNTSWHPLGDSADTPFSRFVPVYSWKSPQLITERRLKILVVIASPANLDLYHLEPIADAERKALHTILQVFPDASLTYLETGTSQRPTLSQLRETLADGYHLVHVLCHGAIIDGGTVLYLENEDGNVGYVTTDELVRLFNDLREWPVFCFLAACESAMQRDSTTFTPLGPALVQRSNVLAVVAMTGQVGIETARTFTAQFYTRLLQHGVVDVAVNEARSLVQGEWDWGVPVLFMRLEDGQLFDYYFSELRRAWFEKEKTLREGIFRNELNGHLDAVTSPLSVHWNSFIKAPGWHKELQDRLNKMHENASQFSELTPLALSFRYVDTTTNYDGILASLRQLIDHAPAVSELVARLRRKSSEQQKQQGGGNNSMVQDAEHLLGDMRYLEKQTEDPSFQRCFLFIGSFGAGKTQFIASLLTTSPTEETSFLLFKLSSSSDRSLEEQILQEINRITGINRATGKVWDSLKEFNTFLKAGQRMRRLVIAIDDLQKWLSSRQRLEDLLDLIQRSTELHAIYWLIALEDTSYYKVAGGKENRLWQAYGYRPKNFSKNRQELPISIGGWLDLDELNRSEKIGMSLLQKKLSQLSQKNEDDSQALQALHDKAEIIRYLSSPFIAWILWELRKDLPLSKVINLNFIEFITYYSDELSRIINPDPPLTPEQIQQCIDLIAEFLAQSDNLTPNRTLLLNRISKAAVDRSELQDRARAEAALAVLERGPLLIRKTADLESGFAHEERTDILFEPFWEYRLAGQLHKTDPKITDEEAWLKVEAWFSRSEGIKQGVFEFLLLLLDKDTANNSSYFFDNMLRLSMDTQLSLTSAMWFAGPKLSIKRQRSLVALTDRSRTYTNAYDVFAFMYFVSESSPEVLNIPARVGLLQQCYQAIHDDSLVDYYFYIVRRFFAKLRDKKVLLACMEYFSGCEVMDITQELAELTIITLAQIIHHNMNDLLDIVLEYLKVDYEKNKVDYEKNKNDYQKRSNVTRQPRYYYRQWILCEFCRTLVDSFENLDSYDLLVEHQWYKPQKLLIGWPASLEMRQEANLALGSWYRNRASGEERQSYIDLIKKLANSSDPNERERAFFLIRHTEFIQHTELKEGKAGVRVDKVFHAILRKLFMDTKLRDLTDSKSKYFKDFEANLEDINQLVQQRRLRTTNYKP